MSLARLVGLVLGGACGLLALVSVMLFAGVGGNVRVAEPDPETLERPLPSLDGGDAFSLREPTAYAMVAQRPLFNEDRRPDPDAATVEEGEGEAGEELVAEEPPPPLEVEVKGIIIAPEFKLAIVTDPKAKSTLRLREGMPLEGELAAWTLSSIEPRKLTFDGQGAEQAEVELVVNTKALAGAPPVKNRNPTAEERQPEADGETAAADGEQMDPEARAEEIRRRVAERRAQLREEAERRRAQRDNQEQ